MSIHRRRENDKARPATKRETLVITHKSEET